MKICNKNCRYRGFLGDVSKACLKDYILGDELAFNIPTNYIPPCEHSEVNEELLEG